MTDKITIPAVAYAAMERERNAAWNRMVKLRESLDETVLAKKVAAASREVDRLQAQLDRFAPEEQQDATPAAVGSNAAVGDQALAGSGGAREPATQSVSGTIANGGITTDVGRNAIDRDDPGPIPDCLDVTKRGRE